MNFLQLAQRLHLLLRIGEERPGSEPTTVIDQQGTLAEMVEWIKASHDDICNLRRTSWRFMYDEGELALVEGGRAMAKSALQVQLPTYDALVPMTRGNIAFLLLTPDDEPGAAEQEVVFVPESKFRGTYDRAPLSTGQPTYFTIRRDGGIEFDTIADRDYTLRVQYVKQIVPLEEDGDEPMIPAEHHNAIVEWAIVNYYCASRDGVREMLIKHDVILRREMQQLFNGQLPDISF